LEVELLLSIVPELAAEAKMVTMLQRSPTYIAALPNKDKVAARIKRLFPKRDSLSTDPL
jgi:cation diffusion facilitator CzcD-associated flavoprotein CzcO